MTWIWGCDGMLENLLACKDIEVIAVDYVLILGVI
jgi:hypothetical protein